MFGNFLIFILETCGKFTARQGIIFGGQTLSFPWVAALMNNEEKAFCGGTLLSKNKVLTAASCIHGKDDAYKFSPSDIAVTLGARNLNASFERGRISVDVESIKIHPDWNVHTESFDADVAVLTLADDVSFNRYIQPICLADSRSEIPSITNGHSVSYGRVEYDGNDKNVLNSIKIPIQNSNEVCFYSNQYLIRLSSSRTFCAGHRNGTGVCTGDGGNGLFVIYQNTYYLRGIVSASLAGLDGCDLYNYAVFTNVPSFYSWINERMNEENIQTTTEESTTTTRRTTTQLIYNRFRTTTRKTTVGTTMLPTTTSSPQYDESRNSENRCQHWYRYCSFGL